MSAPAAVVRRAGARSMQRRSGRRHMTQLPHSTRIPTERECEKALREMRDHGRALMEELLGIREERTKKPRRSTLTSVSKQARKLGIEVARYEIKPDNTIVIVTGKGEPAEPENPWLAELQKKE